MTDCVIVVIAIILAAMFLSIQIARVESKIERLISAVVEASMEFRRRNEE